jgi:hypothetical protein
MRFDLESKHSTHRVLSAKLAYKALLAAFLGLAAGFQRRFQQMTGPNSGII